MSRRQEERARRLYAFWMPRFMAAKGRDRTEIAWQWLAARINDLPKDQRPGAFETVADELVGIGDSVTDGQLRTRTFAADPAVPEALRAQARRAGARGTA